MGRIDTLLASMTIEEKIGQLNMVAASRVVTGPGELRDLQEGIRTGRIGNLLNLWARKMYAFTASCISFSQIARCG